MARIADASAVAAAISGVTAAAGVAAVAPSGTTGGLFTSGGEASPRNFGGEDVTRIVENLVRPFLECSSADKRKC